uniref:NADH-ubiquinone oxidoreductase chain 4L n=1 Tax=Acanthopleura vaillantii TaxID=1169768 RepID=A0AA51RF33_9MOLL|nr:NADH dehydrogenase subunit 4L [Acanthopleura vaillantii]WMQ53042.1 NADH dehydrogenase subunit 4L [Acanthopleura vaillantii]
MMSVVSSMFSVGVIISVLSLLIFCLQRKHLLNSLLSLEMLMLSVFLVILVSTIGASEEGLVVFVFLAFAASEAAMGLSLLVVFIRSHGSDYVLCLSTHKC